MKKLNTLQSITFILALATLTRIVFHVLNISLLNGFGFGETLKIYCVGVYYDIATFFMLSPPVFTLFIMKSIWKKPLLHTLFQWSIRLVLFIFSLLNITDAAYFRFSHHRMEYYDLMIAGDSWDTISSEIPKQYLLITVTIIIIILLIRCVFFVARHSLSSKGLLQVVVLYGISFLIFVLGKDFKPTSPREATLYVPAEAADLSLNTPINLFYSYYAKSSQEQITARDYFPSDYILEHASLKHHYPTKQWEPKNIVIILLESFSHSFLEVGNPYKAPTPFLDSIKQHSMDMRFGFSGGYTSSQGLSCIATSVPNFIEFPFFYSRYRGIKYDSYIEILTAKGYHSSFFFGGNKDHFGFEKALSGFGIDHFYSGEDFGDPHQHDGHWGIYDGPFLTYFAEKLKTFPKPFFSIFFNLSSHYPFALPPDADSNLYRNNKITAHRSIRYVDQMLAKFFDSIKNEDWYDQTLFLFMGDHVSKEQDEEKYNRISRYRIPIFIYAPDGSLQQSIPSAAEHIDIGPTILSLLGYAEPFYSFGKNLTTHHQNPGVMQYLSSNVYQYIDSQYIIEYDENKQIISSVYDHVSDPTLQENLADGFFLYSHYDSIIKLKLQNYSFRILEDRIKD